MMRSFYTKGAAFALSVACLVGNAQAQYSQYTTPSMLPGNRYPSTYTTYYQDQLQIQEAQQLPAPQANEPVVVEGQPGAYESVMQEQHGGSYASNCSSGNCGPAGLGDALGAAYGSPRCGWFGSVSGLIMTRDDENELWYSYDDAITGSQIIGSRDANMDYTGGAEVRVGRYFNGGQQGLEVVYWGISPSTSEFNALASGVTGNLDHTFSFNSLSYDDGLGGGLNAIDNWFEGSARHRLRRNYDFQNVEVNFLNNPNAYTCNRFSAGFLAGFRYLKFDEDLTFSADDFDTTFTGDAREVHYLTDVKNDLYGFQLGANASYRITKCLSLRSRTKFGLFNNDIKHHSRVYGSAGDAVVNNALSPNNGRAFNVTSTKNNVSFVGELDLGIDYRISSRWSTSLGYRAVAYTGVALSTNQFPANFDDLGGVARVDSNGNLILHGGYASLNFNY